ncbi:MAG: B12-binding domain/radical SAM domain-containing protein [Candidatus Kerfeldbacteria bacterium]
MSLRVAAIAAPGYLRGRPAGTTLASKDPASLYNACRYAAHLADNSTGLWGDSNWADGRKSRRSSVLLLNSLQEDMQEFEEMLLRVKPNLLLIGSMTLCLLGAVECAKKAREMFGDQICIVLGGKHVNESVYIDQGTGQITHHVSSPLRLVADGHIDNIFDLVIAGEGEYVIAKIGMVVSMLDKRKSSLADIKKSLYYLSQAQGNYIIGTVVNNDIRVVQSRGLPIDRNTLPSPSSMFGIQTSFDIYPGTKTAHVFSDTGGGCVLNCDWCSECLLVNGSLKQVNTSANRLYRQLQSAIEVVSHDSPGYKTSAFVEDSIMLASSPRQLKMFSTLLEENNLDIKFGGQFTIDLAIKHFKPIVALNKFDFDYIFFGLETIDPESVGGIDKVRSANGVSWLQRAEKLFCDLYDHGINSGVSLLFGLGESRQDRINLFEQIGKWQRDFKFPNTVSLNWAVQHPLKGNDQGMNYNYLNWGIPDDEYLEAMQIFGEASLLYPIAGQSSPILAEVKEISELYKKLLY